MAILPFGDNAASGAERTLSTPPGSRLIPEFVAAPSKVDLVSTIVPTSTLGILAGVLVIYARSPSYR